MKGDCTRDTFDPLKHFTRVMMQQGRPQVDADWNEQVAIFWEFWRNFTSDLLGPYAGPERNCGFGILCEGDFPLPDEYGMSREEQNRLKGMLQGPGDFLIGRGHYYVDGMLSTNLQHVTCSKQPYLPDYPQLKNNSRPYLIYLDVWERHITDVEDETIREIALAGADTCTRAKLVWQVRAFELKMEERAEHGKVIDCARVKENWAAIVHNWQAKHRGHLKARSGQPPENHGVEPAVVSPASRFRGRNNQLYRVEIHKGGTYASENGPTFKYSRENGSIVFPVISSAGPVVTLTHLGRDSRSSLQIGDWVEMVDDDYTMQNRAEPLLQVDKIDSTKMQVTLRGQATSTVGQDPDKHPLIRRWDHKQGDPKRGGLELRDGAALIREGEGEKFWLTLEDGVQVQFKKSEPQATYRTGDYWLIPARIANGDVLWPRHKGEPEAIDPHGVEHHYGPLAIVCFNAANHLETTGDCRPKFKVHTTF